jgi:hypothetical protein
MELKIMTEQLCISQNSREAVEGIMDLLSKDASPSEQNIMKDLKQKMDELPKCGNTRGPRKPSAYNLFVKECLADNDIKAIGRQPDRMKACAVKWNEKKKNKAK